jgi:glutathione S-transferase
MPEPLLVLGNKNLSSWSLRPWLLLRHAGIAFREIVVPFETDGFRDEIHETSPSGRLPVLRDGDLVVWESLAIAEYAAERWPEARLWPDDPAARAHARSASAEMHGGFSRLRAELPFDVVARAAKHGLSTECEAELRRVEALWTECRSRFGASGPFLYGRFSIADAMYAPVVFRLRSHGVALGAAAARAWAEAMLELPAMREWDAGAQAEVAARRAGAPMPSPSSAQHAYAVIFTSQRRPGPDDYDETAARIEDLVRKQPGLLGFESARGPDGFGVTVSYWESLEAIRAWRDQPDHARARQAGRERYYERYQVRVCTVDRGYAFSATP